MTNIPVGFFATGRNSDAQMCTAIEGAWYNNREILCGKWFKTTPAANLLAINL